MVLNIILYTAGGIVFVFIPLYFGITALVDYMSCSTVVEATYLGYSEYQVKGVSSCFPKFSYFYNDNEYNECSREPVNYFYLEKYTKGRKYKIFINKKRPEIFILGRSKADIIRYSALILLGLIFLGLLLYSIFVI